LSSKNDKKGEKMKKMVIFLVLFTPCCIKYGADKDGVARGRIVEKYTFRGDREDHPTFTLSNGSTDNCSGQELKHWCYVSREEYDKHNVGEVYDCVYK
jgi:hypothetical protein